MKTVCNCKPNIKFINEDKTVRAYSRRFHNIYLFITERCQNRCGHCYMGDRLDRGMTMSLAKANQLISYCFRLGAEYLTFVGGEPTLHLDLPHMVEHAVKTGYKKVMIDTNGLLVDRIINNIPPDQLFYVRVSLDGSMATIHDKVRGKGSFDKAIDAIKRLVQTGYHVRVTTTVFQFSLMDAPGILRLAEDLGVELVNFHIFSEEGLGTQKLDWSVSPFEWVAFCELLYTLKGRFNTIVRYPPTWTTTTKLEEYRQQGYKGCIGQSVDRLSIFPDGRSYICSVLFDQPVNYAFFSDESGLTLNKKQNEYEIFDSVLQSHTPWIAGCPAEDFIQKRKQECNNDSLVSMCRLWRTEL